MWLFCLRGEVRTLKSCLLPNLVNKIQETNKNKRLNNNKN